MIDRYKAFLFVGIFFFAVNLGLAQGTLHSTLYQISPPGSSLSAILTVQTPSTISGGPLFTVSYQVIVNLSEPVFTVGRIFGGSTAWAFDLNAPTFSNGTAIYSGTTDMGAFQIADMLANRTTFELNAYEPGYFLLSGPLVAVPEPRGSYLLIAGLAAMLVFRRSQRVKTHATSVAPPPAISSPPNT